MKLKHLFLICLISLLIYGCSKPKVTYYPINAQLKAAFNYQVGTYWIYRDSISGREDSFYIKSNAYAVTKNLDKNGNGSTVENINIAIIDTNISPLPSSNIVQYYSFLYSGDIFDVADNQVKLHNINIEYFIVINYPYQNPMQLTEPDSAHVDNIYNLYNVNGLSYQNVIEVTHTLHVHWYE